MNVFPFEGFLHLLEIDPEGGVASSHRVSSVTSGAINAFKDYDVRQNWHGITPTTSNNPDNKGLLILMNLSDRIFWAKEIRPGVGGANDLSFLGADRVVSSFGPIFNGEDLIHPKGLASFRVADGQQEWAFEYTHLGNSDFRLIELLEARNGGSLLVANALEDRVRQGPCFLLGLDAAGQPRNSVKFELPFDSMQVTSAAEDGAGNFYLAGRVLKDTARNQYNLNTHHGFIAKLNDDFEVQWSKELLAEEFTCSEVVVKAFPDGELLFTYVSFGDLPIIAGRLSSDGELLWRRGYEFLGPHISLSEDKSISFLAGAKYSADWSVLVSIVLAKTLPDGSLPGCPQFTACLELEDMPLPLAPMVWEASPGPILPDVDVEVAPSDFVAEPYCGTPAPPTPYFELPDTLCQGACAALDSLPNALASQAAWKVEGPGGLDTAFTGKTFSWCFDRPGLYLVRQTVWLLGCAEEYEQTVEVLPALELSLGGSRVLCGAPPYALSPASSRPLRSYDWGGGQHSGSLPVDSSGHYRLLASDGHCTAADSLRLVFLRDTLAGPVFEYGPRDTVLCRAFLPYSLEVGGAYPLAYTLDGRPMEGGRAELARAGTYVLGAELHGCPLTDTLRLEVDECPAAIYLPTAFSPNGDGINDQWRPLGKDFEALRLRVYGRWGSLLHEAEGAGAGWDGRSQGKPAPNGTYTLLLDYRNTRTGEEGQAVQAVDLVR